MDRKTTAAYSVLVAITTISASIAVVSFGPNSSLESVPGIFGHSESVWKLFSTPLVLTLVGLVGASCLTSTRIYPRPGELGADAQRAVERYRSTERRFIIGVGILVAFVQLLIILSTAGFAAPFEFGARTTFFVFGALLAGVGNMIPKIPFFSRWWQIDRAIYTKVSRFSGWALTISGVLCCLLAVFAPIGYVKTSVSIVLRSGIGLMIGNALLEAFMAARKTA